MRRCIRISELGIPSSRGFPSRSMITQSSGTRSPLQSRDGVASSRSGPSRTVTFPSDPPTRPRSYIRRHTSTIVRRSFASSELAETVDLTILGGEAIDVVVRVHWLAGDAHYQVLRRELLALRVDLLLQPTEDRLELALLDQVERVLDILL